LIIIIFHEAWTPLDQIIPSPIWTGMQVMAS